jgi:GT2 family glycosyltransferase
MEISIVIINYNTFDFTCKCIESILKYTYSIVYEIILIDNASTEIEPNEFKKLFSDIILIKSDQNVGFSKGNNLGISVAKGEFILLLNSDTTFKNNVPLILHNFLISHENIAAVSGRLEYPDGTIQHNCQRFPSLRYRLFELFRLQKILPGNKGGKVLFGFFFDYKSVAYPDWIWGTCFMFRKNLLHMLPEKKLADDFFMYGEDIQWCLEFKKIGYGVAFDPSAEIIHCVGKSGANRLELMDENMQSFMSRYYSLLHRKFLKLIDSFFV